MPFPVNADGPDDQTNGAQNGPRVYKPETHLCLTAFVFSQVRNEAVALAAGDEQLRRQCADDQTNKEQPGRAKIVSSCSLGIQAGSLLLTVESELRIPYMQWEPW